MTEQPGANEPSAGAAAVFVSYRRDDSADAVGRILDRLSVSVGDEHVFRDIDDIPLGVDFRESIDEALRGATHMLVAIGPGWLSATGEDGSRRLDAGDDLVRLEIEAALSQDIPTIPLLVRGAEMPKPEDLPDSIRQLAFRNGIEIRPDPDFESDVARLVASLGLTPRTDHEEPKPVPWYAKLVKPMVALAMVAAIAAILLFLGGVFDGATDTTDPTTVGGGLVEPDEPVLNWLETSSETVIDGTTQKPGSDVVLQERHPVDATPSRFIISLELDPALGAGQSAEVTQLAITSRDIYTSRSTDLWELPAPFEERGFARYHFVDNNGERSSGVTSAGFAVAQTSFGTGLSESEPGIGVTDPGADTAVIEVDAHFPVDPSVRAVALVPWGSGEDSLLTYLEGYFEWVASSTGGDSQALMDDFLESRADFLPSEPLPGWEVTVSPSSFDADEGDTVHIELQVDARTPGQILTAVRLVDDTDGMSTVSAVVGIVIPSPDPGPAPTVTMRLPATDSGPDDPAYAYDGFDYQTRQWFKEVSVAGVGSSDGEAIPDEGLVWTTDRTDLQPPGLAVGSAAVVRLYSDTCGGTPHVLSLTATDAAGLTAQTERTITIWADCGPEVFVVETPIEGESGSDWEIVGNFVRMQLTFSRPFDAESLLPGDNLVLVTEVEASAGFTAEPVDDLTLLITPDATISAMCNFDPDCSWALRLVGTAETPIRDIQGVPLNGGESDYETSFVFVG